MSYQDKIIYIEGVIVDFDDGSVSIDLKGRLGFMKVPRRMIITNFEFQIGQEIGMNMSFPEVLREEPDEHYRSNVFKRKRKEEEYEHRV